MTSPEWPPKDMRISKSYLLGWSEKPLKPRTPPIHNPYKEVVSSPGAMIEYVASDGRKGKVSGLPNSFPQRLQTAQRLLTVKNLAKLPSEALQEKTASTVAKKSESKIGMLGGMGGLWDEDPGARKAPTESGGKWDKEDASGWTKKQDDELMERKNAGEQWATIEKAMGKSKADLSKRFKDIKPADWRPSQANKGSKGQKQKNNNKNQGKQEKQDGAEKKKTEVSSWETADTGNNQSGDADPWGNNWAAEAADVGNNSGGMGETFEGANKSESPQENTNDDNNGGFGGAASWDNADKKDEDVLPSWQTNDEDNKTTDNKSSRDDNGDSNGGGTSDWKNSSGDTGDAPAETFDSGWPQDKSSSRSKKSSRDSKSRSQRHSKSSRPSTSAKKNNDSDWKNEESVEKKSSRRSDSTKKGNDSSSWGNDSSSGSESNSSWKDDDKKREKRDKKKDDKKKNDDTESTASTVYHELYPDANFSMKDLTLVAKILKEDNKMLWLRIASRFRDKTGRILDPDVFEHKLTGKVASKGN